MNKRNSCNNVLTLQKIIKQNNIPIKVPVKIVLENKMSIFIKIIMNKYLSVMKPFSSNRVEQQLSEMSGNGIIVNVVVCFKNLHRVGVVN